MPKVKDRDGFKYEQHSKPAPKGMRKMPGGHMIKDSEMKKMMRGKKSKK